MFIYSIEESKREFKIIIGFLSFISIEVLNRFPRNLRLIMLQRAPLTRSVVEAILGQDLDQHRQSS
jgi:hypothetical protein